MKEFRDGEESPYSTFISLQVIIHIFNSWWQLIYIFPP